MGYLNICRSRIERTVAPFTNVPLALPSLSPSRLCSYKRDRKEWADLEPVPQDDGPNPVVKIAYSDKCKILNLAYNLEPYIHNVLCISSHAFSLPNDSEVPLSSYDSCQNYFTLHQKRLISHVPNATKHVTFVSNSHRRV